MAEYIKQEWKDAIVDEQGHVIKAGTVIDKAHMEHIEDGVSALNDSLNSEIAERKSTLWNPNILDNWDFRNPINQRGLLEHIGLTAGYLMYCIDRWRLQKEVAAGIPTLKITDKGIEITTPSDGNTVFEQVVEFSELYENLPLTFSLKVSPQNQGYGYISLYSMNETEPEGIGVIGITPQDAGKVISVSGIGNRIMKELRARILVSAGTTVICESVKLERGTISTLANDPPQDYGTELAKCQRYQIKLNETFVRALSITTNYIEFFAPTPVTVRILPTLVNAENIIISTFNEILQTGFTYEIRPYKDNTGILIRATKNNHGMTDTFIWFRGVILDANL